MVDQLRVTANPPVADGELRTRIGERLAQAVDFRNCVICARVKGELEVLRGTMDQAGNDGCGVVEVTVEGGVVTLTGQVISLSHRYLASVTARWVGGCRDVVNLLELVPPKRTATMKFPRSCLWCSKPICVYEPSRSRSMWTTAGSR